MNWLARLAAGILLGFLTWLEGWYERRKTVREGDRRPDTLRRMGKRVREWEDRARKR